MDKAVITISEENEGARLDKFLFEQYDHHYSRTYFQGLIQKGHVLVNGHVVKKHVRPESGDEVQVTLVLPDEVTIEAEDLPLDILYEDSHLLAINKSAGMVVHPAPGNWTGTFVNALMHHCQWEQQASSHRPGIVHRLDKETTGVLIAAKSAEVQYQLAALFANRSVKKEYLTICLGNVGDKTIDAPIARHPVKRKQMRIDSNGRSAISHCKTLMHDREFSLVQIDLETGRTHQIRVHMKHNKTPVLGDATYGSSSANQKYGADRQMLHAHRLQLIHPMTHKPLDIKAEVPDDFAHFVQNIEKRTDI